jgi:hypothetical protein
MKETIDGNQTLAEQEAAIQFKEGKGYILTTLQAGTEKPPTNEAGFDRLPIGEVPDEFQLVLKLPTGREKVWAGKIFVKGELREAAAYRIPD